VASGERLVADYDTSRGSATKTGKKDILAKARADWDRAMERERENVKEAYADLEFLSGHNYSQWPQKQKKDRDDQGRPTLQINTLPQFVHQITGDMRQMKPALKFVPVDSGSDEKVADLYGGLARYIENRSDATAVYSRAADSQVACGIGHWRVLTEYADDSTFNQEIRIAPIEDGVAVLWDPDATYPSKEDANFCFVPVDMSLAAFKETYPEASPASFDDEKWTENVHWLTDDYVRVAEYWVRKPIKRTLALTQDGRIIDLTGQEDIKVAAAVMQLQGARIEERDSYKICRYLISASDVLDEVDWPGRLIPVVPVIGQETRIGRKLIRKGVVRDARDPQRMINYFHSAHTETIALQPKAPFMVTEINVAKYQQLWEQANTQNLPYLVYEPDTKNGGAAPQRMPPPVSSQGVLDGLELATLAQKQVIGIYDAGLGQRSNETSGKAIEARERSGDVGSFLYLDNFSRAIRRTGQIIADLAPHVYDTERTIRIMGEDGKVDLIEINKAEGIGDQAKIINDVTTGSYDVVAVVGPSYTTKREQARDGMNEFLRAIPTVAPLIADKMAKAQDFPMADDIAKRIRATLPPHILAMEEAEKQGMDPEQARQAAMEQMKPPPDPAVMKVQADAELKQAQMQADQQTALQEMQLKMMEMQAQHQQAQDQLRADMQKALMEVQAKIEVAQINAGVGMHKSIVDAATNQYGAMIDAEQAAQERDTRLAVETHKTNTAAETARYAADKRPKATQRTTG
jgi:hypothetical protein